MAAKKAGEVIEMAPNQEPVVIVRPFQFEFQVIAHVEKDGKIVDTVRAGDRIMESSFNGFTVQSLVERATVAMQQKLKGG